MKVQTTGGFGGAVHVFPDEPFAKPIAGPFASGPAARCWVVEKVEAGLSPAKREVWRRVVEQLPAPTDFGLELALIGLVAHGLPLEQLAKYIPRPAAPERRQVPDRRHDPDHRMAAAGRDP